MTQMMSNNARVLLISCYLNRHMKQVHIVLVSDACLYLCICFFLHNVEFSDVHCGSIEQTKHNPLLLFLCNLKYLQTKNLHG